jgi:hypothetical protein
MHRIDIKLLAFSIGFMIGIGSSMLMRERKEPSGHPDIPRAVAIDEHPIRGYDFVSSPSRPKIPVTPASDLVTKKTYCRDPKILPIWNAIRRNKEWREILAYTTESPDCADMFELKHVDLNHDGKMEDLVRGRTIEMCGGVGNCQFWVFEKRGKDYQILLNASDYIDRSIMGQQIRRAQTNGYSDLLLKGHFSAAETSFTDYKFNGRKYVESGCLYEVPDYRGGDQPAKWHFISCKEFYRDLKPY